LLQVMSVALHLLQHSALHLGECETLLGRLLGRHLFLSVIWVCLGLGLHDSRGH